MNKLLLSLLMLLFVLVNSTSAQNSSSSCSKETEEKNKALIRKFYEQVWFSNNPEAVDEIFAPKYVAHNISDRKGLVEDAEKQKKIAQRFWDKGKLSGTIDYQVAECDLVATRWQGVYQPDSIFGKLIFGKSRIPIINVVRFKDGKVVEVWNQRRDVDSFQENLKFTEGLGIGLISGLILLIISVIFWQKTRKSWQINEI